MILRVTRTLFAFAELTKMDPAYSGPPFDYEKILSDLISQVNYSTKYPAINFTRKMFNKIPSN